MGKIERLRQSNPLEPISEYGRFISCRIDKQYKTKRQEMKIKIRLSNNRIQEKILFGKVQLADGSIMVFDGDQLSNAVGQIAYIQDGASDWFQCAPGRYCTFDNTYFNVDEGARITSVSNGNKSKITTSPQNQAFKTHTDKMAKLTSTEIKIKEPASGGMSTDGLAKVKRAQEIEASKPNFWGTKSVSGEVMPNEITVDSKLNQPRESNLTAAKQAKFQADQHYINTGERLDPKTLETHSADPNSLFIEPIGYAEMTEEEKAKYSCDPKTIKASTQKPEVKTASHDDVKLAKSQVFFSAKSSKEMGSAMKKALQDRGYNID
jgi:hypothetical protein